MPSITSVYREKFGVTAGAEVAGAEIAGAEVGWRALPCGGPSPRRSAAVDVAGAALIEVADGARGAARSTVAIASRASLLIRSLAMRRISNRQREW